jgi:hypothetical protein
MKRIAVQRKATNLKDGILLGELEQFVREALDAGLSGFEIVRVTTGWRQQIRTLEVTDERRVDGLLIENEDDSS